MNLNELIERLQSIPAETVFPNGFSSGQSWRGDYSELAFEPKANAKAGDMLEYAMEANGRTYQGWKGGDFKMDGNTTVHIAEWGNCKEESEITSFRWQVMLQEAGVLPIAQPVQPTNEAAKHWHDLYLKQCQKTHDDAARYGAEIVALELEIAQPVQPAALPPNLVETIREAADIINEIDPERAPENMRWSIIDELHNFSLMLAQPVQPADINFCARCGKRVGSSADIHTCTLLEPLTHKRDALVVNLLRLTNLDKHTARDIADSALEGEK